MVDKVALNSLFDATVTSAKFYKFISGTYKRMDADHSNIVVPYPHGLGNDELFVVGWIKSTNSQYPTEVYYFSMPYVDALGDTMAQATWDSDNVYFEWPWDGSITGDSTAWRQYDYTMMVLIA